MLGYSVAAGDAIDILCRHRISAEPFDFFSPSDLRCVLPPVPDGMLSQDRVEPDGNGGTRQVKVASWQLRMHLDDPYYGMTNELPEDWGRSRSEALYTLLGFLNALIRRLRDAPFSVVAGTTPIETTNAEPSVPGNDVPSGQTDGTVNAEPRDSPRAAKSLRRHGKGDARKN